MESQSMDGLASLLSKISIVEKELKILKQLKMLEKKRAAIIATASKPVVPAVVPAVVSGPKPLVFKPSVLDLPKPVPKPSVLVPKPAPKPAPKPTLVPKPVPKPVVSVVSETKEEKAIRILKFQMAKYGLVDWNVRISRAFKTLGTCSCGTKTISLSKNYIETADDADIMNTILHEIAHALTPGQKHNEVWKKKAIEIGCDGKRCADVVLVLKYNYVCGKGCRRSFQKYCGSVERLIAGVNCKEHKCLFKEEIQESKSDSPISTVQKPIPIKKTNPTPQKIYNDDIIIE
jgi:hypothetical protein